jgi:predicted transcriptional regulator
MPNSSRISISLSDTEYAQLRELSAKHRVSVSWLGRQAIVEFLENYGHRDIRSPLSERVSKKGLIGMQA